jgi:hypothetical protein
MVAMKSNDRKIGRTAAAVMCTLLIEFVGVLRPQVEAVAQAEEGAALPGVEVAKPQAAERPFVATFSNQVKVQLIGLSENPSKGKAWWAPDGTRLDNAPYERVPAVMHAGEDQIAREICFRWMDLPENPDFETGWSLVPRSGGMGGGNAYDSKENRIADLTAWAVIIPSGQDSCTVQFSASVHATPWLTIFTARGGNISSMGGMIDGKRQGAIFGAPQAQKGGTEITVSYQIPDRAVRLLAVANDGLPDVGNNRGGAGVLDFSQVTYQFPDLEPERIQRFELQSQKRQFETIEFRNVSLFPDKRTKVEIVRPPAAIKGS